MQSLTCLHPDLENFIKIKRDKTKVTGSNISVMITDEFMKAVEEGTDFILRFPTDKPIPEHINTSKLEYDVLFYDEVSDMYFKRIDAERIFQEFVQSNWEGAEPGLLFASKLLDYSPDGVYPNYRYVSTNPCQPEWATVLTPDGIRTFGEINVGDTIWSETGWTKIVRKECSGVKDVYKYVTSGGTFIGTDTHRIVSRGEKIEVKNAETIDVLAGYSEIYSIKDLDEQDILDGLVMGDGTVQGNDILLCVGKDDADIFLSEVRNLIETNSYNKDFQHKVKTTILTYELPKTYLREIPERFLRGNNHKISGFLRGLYSANGSVVDKRVTLKTASPILREQVQLMLSSIGIRSYYTTNKRKVTVFSNGTYLCRDSYDINITTDRNIFFKKIGFIQRYKTQRLEDTFISENNKPISYPAKRKSFIVISSEHVSTEPVYNITVDNKTHTYWSGGLNVSNCGEQPLPAYDCCRLLALNMSGFVKEAFTDSPEFDMDDWYRACYEQMVIGNIIVDIESAYIQRIIDKIENGDGTQELKDFEANIWKKIKKMCDSGRRCGCGIMGLGDTLAMMNLPYSVSNVDSNALIKRIMETKMRAELDASIDMAVLSGESFTGYNPALESQESNAFYAMLHREFPEQMKRMWVYGRQNVSWSTVAPTGSGSILGQTTGGIEPLFMPFYKRRKKCVLDTDRVDFVDVDGEKFTEYFVVHVPFMKFCETKFNVQPDHWHNITEEELQEMFRQSPYYGNTAPELNVDDRIGMQELVQTYTSSAISSTINLPAETTQEQIAEIYLKAARHNLKGVTIYRDGSRGGVLVSSKQEGKSNFFEEVKAPKRPDELPSELHRIKYNGDDYCVIIGLYNKKPYECFVCCIDDMPEDVKFPIKGTTIKISSGKYNFESDELSIQDIQICDPDQKIAGFLISDMMRHRIPLKRIIKTITKTEFLVTSYWTKLSKIIASYIPDGEFSGEYCPDCWELYKQKVPFRYENGCCICPNGHSKC